MTQIYLLTAVYNATWHLLAGILSSRRRAYNSGWSKIIDFPKCAGNMGIFTLYVTGIKMVNVKMSEALGFAIVNNRNRTRTHCATCRQPKTKETGHRTFATRCEMKALLRKNFSSHSFDGWLAF